MKSKLLQLCILCFILYQCHNILVLMEKYHYSEISAIKDNMECILDINKGE